MVAAPLRFALLGPVRAWRGDGELRLGSPQQRAVLAVILLREGGYVSVGDIVDAVWGSAPPSSAEHVVRTYVHRLRRALGGADGDEPVIVSAGNGYTVATAADALDVTRFRDRIQAATTAVDAGEHAVAAGHLRDALALWRGTPLAGMPGEYANAQRHGLEALHRSAVTELIAALIESGAVDEAVARLPGLIVAHPFDERLRELQMLALYRSGRQAEALGVYQEARTLLADELGVDPGPELTRMHEDILRAEAGLAATPRVSGLIPAQLPADLPGFVGRGAELARARSLLVAADSGPAAPLVALVTGMAGVGKSSFAVHWAYEVAHLFPDGQLHLDLRGFDPVRPPLPPAMALRAMLEALGVAPQQVPAHPDRMTALFRSLLAGKRVLVVLDNARDAEQVRPLLPGAGRSLVIVTSRDRLSALTVTQQATRIALDVLGADEACELLVRRSGCPRAALGGPPDPADWAMIEEIVTLCGRLPLALAVVAARVAAHPDYAPAAVLAELREGAGSLDAFSEPDATVDVRTVFSWSLRTLPADAARLLRLLSLHPATVCDLPAAASLAGLPLGETRRLLGLLTGAHLLTEPAPGRYGIHDLVCAFAAEQVGSDPAAEQRAALRRLLDHYVHTAHRADVLLQPHRTPIVPGPLSSGAAVGGIDDQDAAWEWFAAERVALLAAVELAHAEGFDTQAWQLAWSLETYLVRTGRGREALNAWQLALAGAGRVDDPLTLSMTLWGAGRSEIQWGNPGTGTDLVRRAVEVFTTIGHLDAVGGCEVWLGTVALQRERTDDAIVHYRRALGVAEDPRMRASAMHGAAAAYAAAGDGDRALELSGAALDLYGLTGDRHGRAAAWDTRGSAHQLRGDHGGAVSAYRHAIETFHDVGDRVNEGLSLDNLGDAHAGAGDAVAARRSWHQALDLLTELGHPLAGAVRAKLAVDRTYTRAANTAGA